MRTGGVIAAAIAVAVSAGAAIAAETWTRTTQPNGAALYACASADCGRDATIICKVFPPDTVATSEAFAARIEKQVADLRTAGRDVSARPPTRKALGDRVLHRTSLRYGGKVPGFETGFLVGPHEAFAVSSMAADAKVQARNFDRFVARLAKLPVGPAAAECPP